MATTNPFTLGVANYHELYAGDTLWTTRAGYDLDLTITACTPTSVCLDGHGWLEIREGILFHGVVQKYVRAPDPAAPKNKKRWRAISAEKWNNAILAQDELVW